MRTQILQDQVKLKNNATELQRLTQANADMQALLAQINALELKLNDAKAVLKGVPALEKAKAEINALRQGLANAESDLAVAESQLQKANNAVVNIHGDSVQRTGSTQTCYSQHTRENW
jgi:seryl-tRNA synthetase